METNNYEALPMMGFRESVKTCFKKYFDLTGRARRSEYWWFGLFAVLAMIIWALFGTLLLGLPIGMAVEHLTGSYNVGLYMMVGIIFLPVIFFIIPSYTVQVRRLHDTGRSSLWVLVAIILDVAAIVLTFSLFGKEFIDFGFFEEYKRAFELSTAAGVAITAFNVVNNVLSFILLVFSILDSHKTENKYGPSPKYYQPV